MTETVSATRRRGRPAEIPPGFLTYLRSQNPELTTTRALHDRYYSIKALAALTGEDGDISAAHHWLIPGGRHGPGVRWKWGLLVELGRVAVDFGDDHAREWADVLCSDRPSVRDGAGSIRQWRTGKAPGSAMTLTTAILAHVAAYIGSHPELTSTQVLAALDNARHIYSEAASESDDERTGA